MSLFDDRTRLEVLRRHDCLELLRTAGVGRIGLTHEDRITIVPVNYLLDDEVGIVFRSDPGAKLDAALAGQDVAFEVDGVDDEQRLGWDVLVQGRASVVDDPETVDRLERLGLHPWAKTEKEHWVRIELDEVWGRRVLSTFDADALTREGY
jgi:nitroimidazol reductase NimA-like FMN-containing flavoprotein (pyridoxamine 5'-phosphate oxidase superfamily)